MQPKAHVRKLFRRRQILDAQQLRPELFLKMPRRVLLDLAADHLMDHAIRIRGSDLVRRNVFTVAQYRYRVAQPKDFLHAMRDINDRNTPLFELTEQPE